MATTKKKTAKKAKTQPMRSFTRYVSTEPFFTFKITHQTAYWLVIGMLVLGLGVWMTLLTVQVQRIYDQVEVQSSIHEDPLSSVQKRQ